MTAAAGVYKFTVLFESGLFGAFFAVRMGMFGIIAILYLYSFKNFISAVNIYLVPLSLCALIEYGGKSAVFKSVFAYCF